MRFTVPFDVVSCPRPHFNMETGKQSHAYLSKNYRKWRLKFDDWFEDWLEKTNYELVKELTTLPLKNGTTAPRINGKIRHDFYGFSLKAGFYIEPIKDIYRLTPISSRVYDLDNGLKTLIDGIFESETFKAKKINDRYINSINSFRRYALKGDHAHVDVDLSLIKLR